MHARVQMKVLGIVMVAIVLYVYALFKTKSLFEGPNHMKICEYELVQKTCGVLGQLGN